MDYNHPHQELFPFLANMEILPEWDAAAARFLATGGAVMVMGASDTGKSTLCRYLVYRAYAAGRQTALVDLDLGQSHLGPPAALGLGFFPPRGPGDDSLFADGLYFIGQTSPVGAILEIVVGCRTLVDQAQGQGITAVVVNTSGFTQGPGALRLKRAQAELIRPSLILGLQEGRELEPILKGLGGANAGLPAQSGCSQHRPKGEIIRLPVSSRVTRKTPEQRQAYRKERFGQYLQAARVLSLPWRDLVLEGLPLGHDAPLDHQALRQLGQDLGAEALYGESQGRRAILLLADMPQRRRTEGFHPEWEQVHWLTWPSLHLRLAGLLDRDRRTLALGLILPGAWNPESLSVLSPLSLDAIDQVRFVKVGKIRVTRQGQELNHV